MTQEEQTKKIKELENNIIELRYGLIRKHGLEYERFYYMSLEEFEGEYCTVSTHEFKLREILADRKRAEKRKNGIMCECTHTSICGVCDSD